MNLTVFLWLFAYVLSSPWEQLFWPVDNFVGSSSFALKTLDYFIANKLFGAAQ
jgi:hypothetical protein